ncbi:MAG: AraC family transcriptional regulator [Bacteroidales bacterium]|jgi:hypothetical protein|nr:AraC family transcriptional regulator [Bacteroidales bacterium]
MKPYIDCITYATNVKPGKKYTRCIPDGSAYLTISLDPTKRSLQDNNAVQLQHYWFVVSQLKQSTFISENNTAGLEIKFKAGALYLLTRIPQHEFSNNYIDASLILGRTIYSTREELINKDAADINADFLVNIFGKYLDNRDTLKDERLISFFESIANSPLSSSVTKSGFSQKHFIHFFKQHFGITPKKYLRIKRFNQLTYELIRKTDVDWQELIFKYDFFDQSHLIKEFYNFSDLSPTEYLKFRTDNPRYLLMD